MATSTKELKDLAASARRRLVKQAKSDRAHSMSPLKMKKLSGRRKLSAADGKHSRKGNPQPPDAKRRPSSELGRHAAEHVIVGTEPTDGTLDVQSAPYSFTAPARPSFPFRGAECKKN